MAAECARNALLQKVVDNKTDSGIDMFQADNYIYLFFQFSYRYL